MIILDHSTYDETTVGDNLGMPEYSYWFVRKAFQPVLQRFGVVVPVAKPEQDADRIYRSAQAHGRPCLFLSFNPPSLTTPGLACPTVPVFAWEYDTIPDETWDEERRNNWVEVLEGTPAAITHSRSSVKAVRRSLGPDYPIWSIPAPLADRNAVHAGSARGWREPFELELGDALVFDSRTLDLSLFSPGSDLRHARALSLLRRTAAFGPGRKPRRLRLQGVVYTSVFNPADGRKNWPDMLAGFIYAFRDQPDATLILKTTHRDLEESVTELLREMAKLGAFRCRILIVHGMLDDIGYAALVEATSYAVNTSHGEGQCLPLMEFMSAGRPAVAPAHTAMADYVTAENAFIVADHQRPASWPQDVRQAIRCLRHQIEFADLVRAFRSSFQVAREDPRRYDAMSRAAVTALGAFCSDEVVHARMAQVLDHLAAAPDETPRAEGPTTLHTPDASKPSRIDGFALGLQDSIGAGWFNEAAGELAPGFPVGAEDVVVDVGCGDGGAPNFCAGRGAHVVLADRDEDRLTRAAAWLRRSPARKVEAHVTDADPLPLADGCASRVICMEVLEHVDDTAVLMGELARIGRPGARYLITVPAEVQERIQQHLAPPEYFERPNHVRIIDADSFAAMVEAAGLRIEQRYSYGFYWSIWWMLFWQCSTSLDAAAAHPLLASWAQTWAMVLKARDGLLIQKLLDELMPKNQVIVASKPS